MRLYHGSNVVVERPDLARSKPFKDFGRGFYLSPILSQAEERARQVFDLLREGGPCVTVFDWDEEASRRDGLEIKFFEDYCEEWAECLKAIERTCPNLPRGIRSILSGDAGSENEGEGLKGPRL